MEQRVWLEVVPNERWEPTKDFEKAMDHEGRTIVAEDDAEALMLIQGECPGLHAHAQNWQVVLDEKPIFWDCKDAFVHCRDTGEEVRVLGHVTTIDYGRTSALQCWQDGNPVGGLMKRRRDGKTYVYFDLETWQREETRIERERKERELTKWIDRYALQQYARELADNIGVFHFKGFRVSAFVAWLLAHDSMMGRRATNKVLKSLAIRWRAHHKHYRKHYGRWMGEKNCRIVEERLRSMVRFPDHEEYKAAAVTA
jgi:hypothetical protein